MSNTNAVKYTPSQGSTYTALQEHIFRALCMTAGTKVNQRALAARLKVTPAAVSRALPALQQAGLVLVKDHGEMNLKEIELDRENRRAVQLKRAENLRTLYLSGFVDAISERYAGCAIVLFGSYAKGEDVASSDIDIAIIGATEKRFDLAPYEAKLERPIRMMYADALAKLMKEFRESICNGIVLAGGIAL
jgi:predicted nucleotidyltransferase